jgi:hypothetical protein
MHSTVSRIGYAVVDIKINLHSVVMVSEANASNGERELVSLCSGVDIWVLGKYGGAYKEHNVVCACVYFGPCRCVHGSPTA